MDDNVQVRFGAQTSDLDSDLTRLTTEFRALFTSIESEVKRMSSTVQSSMKKTTQSVREGENQFQKFEGTIERVTRRLAAVGLVLGIGQIARGVVSTVVEFERLRAVLTTLEGDGAGARFADLKKFAAETPYDLQQVVTAFTKLKAQGLDPGNEALRSYGNIASAMGKSLNDITEAATDAAVGEFERMKEFGIKAQQQGDKITFLFKGQSTTVKRSSEEIQKYLRNIGDTDFAGAMERQMATLGGAFSNFGDAVSGIADSIGTGGLSSAMNEVTRDLTEAATASDGFAERLGEGLGVVILAVWDILKGFGSAVADIFSVLGSIISAFTGQTEADGNIWANIFRGTLILINGFAVGVRVAFITIGYAVKTVTSAFMALLDIANKVLHFDFKGAANAYREWGTAQAKAATDAGNAIVNALQEGKAKQDKIVAGPPPKPKFGKPEDYKSLGGGAMGKKAGGGKDGSAERMTAFRDELQQRIQSEAGYYKDSTQLEIDFWKGKLAIVGAKSKEAQQIRQTLFQLEKQKAREGLEIELTALDDKQNAAKDDMAAQMSLQNEKMALVARTYGEDSQQYRNLLREKVRMQRDFEKEVVEIERERIDRVAKIAQIGAESENEILKAQMEARKEAIEDAADAGDLDPRERMVALGQALDEQIAMEQAYENRIYQIKVNSLRDQIALMSMVSPERRRMLGELEVMEAEHNARIDEMNAASAVKLAKHNRDVVKMARDQWEQTLAPISNAFNGMLQSMISGTQSFKGAFIGAMDQLFSQFISNVVNMGTQWIATELAKTGATTTGAAIRTGAEATAAATSSGIAAASGTAQIATNAAVGASGAFAATAPIPFVGPALAPGVAAAAMAAILGFGMLISAKGGADIGSGVNPMAQLHEEEMVLPAHIANPLRQLLAGAGPRMSDMSGRTKEAGEKARSSMGNAGDNNLHYSPIVNSNDTSLEAMLRREAKTMQRFINRSFRDGKLKARKVG